jgi:quinoprotein glucose dehydrogenase
MRLSLLLVLVSATWAPAARAQHGEADERPVYAPQVAAPSAEGRAAMQRFELPEGFAAELWAAEPHLANPVAFYVDFDGRVWVAETFRLHAGVTDMRSHMDWLEDELAAKTVADRVAFLRKNDAARFERYTKDHERIRLILDTDGDGVGDLSTVYADGFNDPAAGIAAGLLVRGEDVYYTCIPDLWRLRDTDGDGAANERVALHTGYGVKIALLGHDMHGLRMGPDGRLYYSIGDRGFHIEFEGKTLAHSNSGAVLRCEPDGSRLEVFATGLRNPQELVFDDHGNLFSGDNNSDGGDRARWVYLVEGGETGWRHHYQYVTEPNLRGPWNAEQGWHPFHAGQPAYLVPPIANFINGPSGLTYYPGVGWGDAWRGTFFLCEFRGSVAHSGVYALRNEPEGAGFRIVDDRKFLWNSLATDVDFGPDGRMYVSDWVEGWGMTGKGRLYTVAPAGLATDPQARRAARLLAEGMRDRAGDELLALLAHPHRDVRQEAHLELAARVTDARQGVPLREGLTALVDVAMDEGADPLARLHATWAIGIVARRRSDAGGLAEPLAALTEAADLEVRCQALKMLGDAGDAALLPFVRARLAAPDARERFFAVQALGKLSGGTGDVDAVAELLAHTNDQDPWLRHAAIWAWVSMGDREGVLGHADSAATAVRRGVCVALRRWEDPRVARFLCDAEPTIVAEAARAIYDVPILDAMPALARRITGPLFDDWYLARRCLNANRVVHDEQAEACIALWLTTGDLDPRLEKEAFQVLAEWREPSSIDRVIGSWRPIEVGGLRSVPEPGFDAETATIGALATAGERVADEALGAYLDLVRQATDAGWAAHRVVVAGHFVGGRGTGAERRRMLELLLGHGLDESERARLLELAMRDEHGAVRAAALERLSRTDPAKAVALLEEQLAKTDDRAGQQEAALALGRIEDAAAAAAIARWIASEDSAPAALELLESAEEHGGAAREAAARYRASFPQDDALRDWRETLVGGDAARGRKVFLEKAEVSCLRCHRVGRDGQSEVGPELTDVGVRLTREELLEAIVLPNETLAEGYESWMFLMDDDELVVGRVLSEEHGLVVVLDKDGETWDLPQSEIKTRKRDVSAMPADHAEHLSARELRDLVEFLATRRE